MYPYRTSALTNESGSSYGTLYTLLVEEDQQEAAARWLIESVIGEDRFYGNRDVWDQIEIDFSIPTSCYATLGITPNLGDNVWIVVSDIDNGSKIEYPISGTIKQVTKDSSSYCYCTVETTEGGTYRLSWDQIFQTLPVKHRLMDEFGWYSKWL